MGVDGSEGVLEARVGREVSVGGTTVHPIEEIKGSVVVVVGGRGGGGVLSSSSRKSL